jgi:hypothetical protein
MDNPIDRLTTKILQDKIKEFNNNTYIKKHNFINNFFNILLFVLYVIFGVIILIILLIINLLINGALEIFNSITKIPTEKLQETFQCEYDLTDCDSLFNLTCNKNNFNQQEIKIPNILFNLPNTDELEVSYISKNIKYNNFKISQSDLELFLNKFNVDNKINSFIQQNNNENITINNFFFHGIVSNCLAFVDTINNMINYLESYNHNDKDLIKNDNYQTINLNINFYSINLPGFYGKNEINIDNMSSFQIISFYTYVFRRLLLDLSNKNDINNVYSFSCSGFLSTFIYTKIKQEKIEKIIDIEKYNNNLNDFIDYKINNLNILNSPGLTSDFGINSIYNAFIFKYLIPYTNKFYNTSLGKYLYKYYNFLFFKDETYLNKRMFYQYFFYKKFLYYNPYKIVSKFINYNLIYCDWNSSSLQNIETLLSNSKMIVIHGRLDTYVNPNNSELLEKYINNHFPELNNNFNHTILNIDHTSPSCEDFNNLFLTNLFYDIINQKEKEKENNIFNQYEENNEPTVYSFYNPLMQLSNIKDYEKFILENKI